MVGVKTSRRVENLVVKIYNGGVGVVKMEDVLDLDRRTIYDILKRRGIKLRRKWGKQVRAQKKASPKSETRKCLHGIYLDKPCCECAGINDKLRTKRHYTKPGLLRKMWLYLTRPSF